MGGGTARFLVVLGLWNLCSTQYLAGIVGLSPRWQGYPQRAGDKSRSKFKVSPIGAILTNFLRKRLSFVPTHFSKIVPFHPQPYPQNHSGARSIRGSARRNVHRFHGFLYGKEPSLRGPVKLTGMILILSAVCRQTVALRDGWSLCKRLLGLRAASIIASEGNSIS